MKAISIWQPFATMIVKGYKVYETRGWPAPPSVFGQRIAIASTKVIRPEQRQHFADPEFQKHYEWLQMPQRIEDMPLGYVLGTVVLDGVELMTGEFMDGVSLEEQSYGFWTEGNYAWRLLDPVEFPVPIAVRGGQGLYNWSGLGAIFEEEREATHP